MISGEGVWAADQHSDQDWGIPDTDFKVSVTAPPIIPVQEKNKSKIQDESQSDIFLLLRGSSSAETI